MESGDRVKSVVTGRNEQSGSGPGRGGKGSERQAGKGREGEGRGGKGSERQSGKGREEGYGNGE